MKKLLIIGAGGFGHMIKETAAELGYEEIVFLDDAVKGADVIGDAAGLSGDSPVYMIRR